MRHKVGAHKFRQIYSPLIQIKLYDVFRQPMTGINSAISTFEK